MSMAKVSTYRAPAVIIEQKTGPLENEGHDSLEKLIMETIGKEQFLSFSRPGESPIQWIQLLNALDPQGHGNRGSQADNANEENYRQQENCDVLSSFASGINRTKEPGNIVKASGLSARMSSSEHVQTLKIPEAVIAFAQAAAKANGEREKYLPGWPLLSPSKVQLQKCGKCSRGFCSPINYRRHIRMHRRSLNFNKVSPKNRELLGAFWDKLSLDEATELASIKDMSLEEVSGSSIMRALASLMRKPGFSSLPQAYLKAGAILLTFNISYILPRAIWCT
uniref:Lissencephaly-1 n=1 Tax=Anthurium amnicola TaxID=1678845 RepID=A0A1D1XV41_9ARAE